jgi:hypothetical protein
MTQMKKLHKKRNGFKNTTDLTEHLIFIPSTHLWTFIDSVFFSDCNGIKKLYPLIRKFPRKKRKYVASKLDLSLFHK